MSHYLNISGTLTDGVSRVRITNPALSYDDAEAVDRDISKFDVVAIGAIIFLFFGFNQATHGILLGSKRVVLGLKSRIVGKEAAQ